MSTFAQFCSLGPFTVNGQLITAGKLYHYAAGTNTLKNLWSDRGQTVTLNQPFVADGNGVWNFFADGLYKLVIKDANDLVLYTLDNVLIQDFTSPSFAEGAAISSASTIGVGPEVFQHVTGSVTIATITGTIPFTWLVFDGSLTLTHSSTLLCPGAVSLTVNAGDAVFLLNEGSGVWRIAGGNFRKEATQDGRTNTVNVAHSIVATTTGTPAAGIGTGLLLQAKSADETPSDFGQLQVVASDVTAGSEDTYWELLVRVAGAALSTAYRFVTTTGFRAIFTHANSADRTYTLPNYDWDFITGTIFKGPTSCGTGSTRSHEGTVVISADQNLSGIHFYTDFTLNSGKTLTVPAGKKRLIIMASGTITINGTINATGAGGEAGTADPRVGGPGTDQPGGTGSFGSSAAGPILIHGCILAASGSGQLTGSNAALLADFLTAMGGSGGSYGSDGAGGYAPGGNGGGSIILIAPSIVLGSTAILKTNGDDGGGGLGAGGGGGGAGNVYVRTHTLTDAGAVFTMSGGAGGGAGGSAGADGIKQINIY